MRAAHRAAEWDGWEEGLVESILGPEEQEEDWFKSWEEPEPPSHDDDERPGQGAESPERTSDSPVAAISVESLALSNSSFTTSSESEDALAPAPALALAKRKMSGSAANGTVAATAVPKVVVAVEKEREKLLNATGDFCGGRGGELGRRLEAWLYVNGDAEGRVELGRRWKGEGDDGAE